MFSIFPLCAAVLLVGMVTEPLDAQEPAPELDTAAVRLIRQLNDGRYAEAAAGFDSTMRQALPEPRLRQTWETLQGQVGALQKLGTPQRSTSGGYIIVVVPATFERAVLDAKVVFDGEQRVSGLFFQPHQEAGPQVPPYADTSAFSEREMPVGSGAGALPGTLSVPTGAGPFPAVVLVHGSGPNDRDETVGGVKPFRDLAWGLASRGIAVYRYEKRTRAHPEEFHGPFTVDRETVNDAVAAVELLRQTPGVDSARVFVLGHSLGGMMAPRIGQRDPDIAGLIIMAGTTRRLEDVMEQQLAYLQSLPGGDSKASTEAFDRMRAGIAEVRALTPADSASPAVVLGAPAAYWLDLDAYQPVAVARTLSMPMLILQGERDYQVTMADYANWREGLAGDSAVTFKTYPALNHLFVAGSGKSTPSEYAQPAHLAREVVDDIVTWVERR